MSYIRSTWVKFVPVCYRLVTLLMAVVFIYGFDNHRGFIIHGIWLVGIALLELILSSLPPFIAPNWRRRRQGMVLSVVSTVLCLSLLILSGTVNSPFTLYSLSSILSSALFHHRKYTVYTAGGTVAVAILSCIFNPSYPVEFTPFAISQMTVYFFAAVLIALLPFVVNIDLRHNLEKANIQEERQRLSREIHDGVAQTLHALCWQVQQVRHQLDATDIKDRDVEQLEHLAEKARADILQALDILRNRDLETDLRTMLTGCLEDFKGSNGIDYTLNIDIGRVEPDSEVKKELVSICREALANVKKHSMAHSVEVVFRQMHSSIDFSISDDGRGFDAASFYRRRVGLNGHHGLSVMQERAQMINGKFRVLSLPDHGTEVKVEVPLYHFKGKV